MGIVIPGEPVAQGRPRTKRLPDGRVRVYDPPASLRWKAIARLYIRRALDGSGIPYPVGPVSVDIEAVFSCPVSTWRKRRPQPCQPKATAPDIDNIAKAFLDAATGLLWADDCQVTRLLAWKIIGAQGEEPHVQAWIKQECE